MSFALVPGMGFWLGVKDVRGVGMWVISRLGGGNGVVWRVGVGLVMMGVGCWRTGVGPEVGTKRVRRVVPRLPRAGLKRVFH